MMQWLYSFFTFLPAILLLNVSRTSSSYHFNDQSDVLITSSGRVRGISNRSLDHVDFVIGGLFVVHFDTEGVPCGRIRKQQGLERVEAMLYAIDSINSDPNLLGNLTLGYDIRDTCSREEFGLTEVTDMLRNSATTCDRDPGEVSCSISNTANNSAVNAVVGPGFSAVSVPVATLLRLLQVPQISYGSTSAILNDRERYSYFFRTIASDDQQVRVMIDLMLRFNWTYASTIYDDDFYGSPGISAFRSLAATEGICIDVDQAVDDGFSTAEYTTLASRLINSTANVVIVFASQDTAVKLFSAVDSITYDHQRRFLWIGGDAWAGLTTVVSPFSELVSGAFGTLPRTTFSDGFNDYYSQLTLSNNLRDPWFTEFFEALFSCNASTCNRTQPVTNKAGYKQGSFIPLIIDAVYSVAHALQDFLSDNCKQPLVWHRENGTCDGQRKELNGATLVEYVRNVNFTSPTGNVIVFDSNGQVEGSYSILNYQESRRDDGKITYSFKHVGQWDGMLELYSDATLQFGVEAGESLNSDCPFCGPGQYKEVVQDICCGICLKCLGRNFSNGTMNDECSQCDEVQWGNDPLNGNTGCVLAEESYLKYDDPKSIVLIILAIIGILSVTAVAIVMGIYWKTPIIKASGREHMVMLLIGITLSFLLTAAYVSRPSLGICIIQKIGLWLSFTLIFASLLVKLIQITRIFYHKQVKKLKYTSHGWQLLFICAIMGGLCVIVVISLIVKPPTDQYSVVPNAQDPLGQPTVVLECRGLHLASIILITFYDSVLIIACNVLAICTIRFPRNFNESRYIMSSTLALGLIWVAFIPAFYLTSFTVRTAVVSFCVNLAAFTVLVCVFGPRVVIVVFFPRENKDEYSEAGSKKQIMKLTKTMKKSNKITTNSIIVTSLANST